MISFFELLRSKGFQADPSKVKLVRHKGDDLDMNALRRSGWFETYQQFQGRPVFDGCSHIIATIGEEGSASRFVGVYSVGSRTTAAAAPFPPECPYPEWAEQGRVHYSLSSCSGFEDLEDRVVIDWGKGALAWHQWFTDRAILEIRRKGRALPPFKDFLRVHISFAELKLLTQNPGAHADWMAALSAVGGIYLIVDGLTGAQYVGSATGAGGIWQRWCDYAKTGHGGNQRLEHICLEPGERMQHFTFSILETFSRSLVRDEAIRIESFFKHKLGTRVFGLNAN
ncbi:MAG: GIY-YIG nuclease family protein [Acidovorax sp.]|uniref:GIY-YIG nuclease family protein n=1 Tax=Acidovorax sp. TaxID=1872122 RepID=UPI00391C01FF